MFRNFIAQQKIKTHWQFPNVNNSFSKCKAFFAVATDKSPLVNHGNGEC